MNSKIPFYQKKRFLLWAVFGWSLGVLAIFYWAHKPVPAELAIKSLVPPGDLITALLAVSLCGALGRKLVGGASLAGLERFGLQAALGSGVLGTGWLLIGLAGGYQRWTAWILLGAGLVLLRREAAGWWGELGLFKSLWAQAGRVEKLLAGACGLLLTFQLLLALAPPTHWDALAYHLELPHLYLQAGRLIFVPYNLFWGNPQLGEMLFTFAAALGQLQTAPVLSTALGAVFLAGMMGFTRRVTAEWLGWDETTATRAGWAAAAALMAGFSIRHQLSWGYVDILAAPMGLGLLVCVFEWLRQRQDSWLRWAGVFLGLAVGVKYPSALLGLAVYLVILFTLRPMRTALKAVLQSGAISLAVFSPWLLKNWIFTGNPLFPYLIPSVWASTLRVQAASLATGSDIPILGNLLFPFSSVLMGGENGLWYGAEIGVVALWMGAVGWWLYWKRVEGRMMTLALVLVWAMAGGVSLYLWQFQQIRIYFALLPIPALLAGTGWGWLQAWSFNGIRLRRLLGTLLILVMALACWQDSLEVVSVSPLQAAMGIQPAQTFLENNLGWYAVAMKGLGDLPQGSKVMMLWEPRGLYARGDVQPDVWIDTWRMAYWTEHTPEKILMDWRAGGFTHILYYRAGADMIRSGDKVLEPAGWQALDQLLSTLPGPVSYGGVYSLYTSPRP